MRKALLSTLCLTVGLGSSIFAAPSSSKMYLISPKKYNLEEMNQAVTGKTGPHLSDDDVANLSRTIPGILSQVYANQDYISITPQLKQRVEKLKNLNNYRKDGVVNRKEFMMDAVEIFDELSDLHTGFSYGFPYNCFLSGFPLKIKRIANPNAVKDHQKYRYVISEKGDLDSILQAIQNKQFADNDSASFYSNIDLEQLKKQFAEINVGDEVTAIKGLAVQKNNEYTKAAEDTTAHFYTKDDHFLNDPQDPITQLSALTRTHRENTGSTLARASDLIFSRFGGYMPIPGSGNLPVEFQLTLRQNGENKVVTFPYFTTVANDPMIDSKGQCASLVQTTSDSQPANIYNGGMTYPNEVFEDSIPSSKPKAEIANDKEGQSISTHVIQYHGKPFAYIKIKSFLPSGEMDADYKHTRHLILESVYQIQQFVLKNDSKIHGVVFDVRDNPGGYGSYATLLAKLFASSSFEGVPDDVRDIVIYPLNTKANQEIYSNLRADENKLILDPIPTDKSWALDIIDNAIEKVDGSTDTVKAREHFKQKFSVLDKNFDSDPNDSSEFIFQGLENLKNHPDQPDLYDGKNLSKYVHMFDTSLKSPATGKPFPLAVLVNGKTFSSGDLFTAAFQDYKIGHTYGEDTNTTGGGGANVIFYNNFQTGLNGPLNTIPNFDADGNPEASTYAPVLPNDIFLSFGWNRVIRASCVVTDDNCDAPDKDRNFIERYYKDFFGKRVIVNGVRVDHRIESTLADIRNPQNVEKQPFVQHVLNDLLKEDASSVDSSSK